MWSKIRKFFKDSESIFLARFSVFMGVILEVVVTIDPTLLAGFVSVTMFPIFLVLHGLLAEYMRRRRDEDLNSRD